VVLLLLVWEAVSRSGLLSATYFPAASSTIHRLVEMLGSTTTWASIGQTALTWALGLLIGTAVAVPLGFLLGASSTAYRFVRIPIELFKPIPPVVFIPPAVLLLGTGQQMKLVLVSYAVFWPVLLQSIAGIENIDPVARNTLRCLHVRALDRIRFLFLPSAWPYVMAGLRIAASLALIATVVTELVANASGLGRDIALAQISGLPSDMYALILIAGLLGLMVNRGFQAIERTTLAWNRRAES
jgi:ABC-type nitrate/sulfonate/bicarbonate transport system permease component